MISRFWNQENKAFRNMQLVFTFFTLNFLLPSLSYFFAPETAIAQFKQIGELLGVPAYPFLEDGHVWRVLAFGNVFTLGFICLLLQLNIRRFYSTIPVFVVLKACSALGYLYVYLFQLSYPVFLVVFFYDALPIILIPLLGKRAYDSLTDAQDLIPPLLWEGNPPRHSAW